MYSAPIACSASAALEGGAQRRVAVRLQERVEPLDFVNPRARPPMRQLGQIRERRGAEIDQMLPLQIAPRALAGDGRHALGAMLGQDRALAGLEFPLMVGTEPAGDDPHAIAIEIQRARQANRVRRHRVRMAVVHHDAGRTDAHGNPQRQAPLARPSAAAAARAPPAMRAAGGTPVAREGRVRIGLGEPLAQLPLEILAVEEAALLEERVLRPSRRDSRRCLSPAADTASTPRRRCRDRAPRRQTSDSTR